MNSCILYIFILGYSIGLKGGFMKRKRRTISTVAPIEIRGLKELKKKRKKVTTRRLDGKIAKGYDIWSFFSFNKCNYNLFKKLFFSVSPFPAFWASSASPATRVVAPLAMVVLVLFALVAAAMAVVMVMMTAFRNKEWVRENFVMEGWDWKGSW